MSGINPEEEAGGCDAPEPPKAPKRPRTVAVYNTSRKRKYFSKNGVIPPQTGGRIPVEEWDKIKGTQNWLKRAERGDVI